MVFARVGARAVAGLIRKSAKSFRQAPTALGSQGSRLVHSFARPSQGSTDVGLWRLAGALALGGVASASLVYAEAAAKPGDYEAVRKAISDVLDDEKWDDGSWGPVFVRLGWHAAGTYDKKDGSGGPGSGASMRFNPEAKWGANAGLDHARAKLEPIKKKFPWISYADLWSLAAAVAVEEMGGPKIPWGPGRGDAPDGKKIVPDGRLPDATQGQDHLRQIFYRMGFNDREIVALSGAHALGRCHTDRSGFKGPWTRAPTTFSNEYFRELVENKWTKKKWNGPEQFEDPTGELMMLPTDMALLADKEFAKYVKLYAKDEQAFFKDFAAAFSKLLHLGLSVKVPAA